MRAATTKPAVIHCGQRALDESDIRFGHLPHQWKNDISDLPPPDILLHGEDDERYGHQAVVVPGVNDKDDRFVVLGGIQLEGMVDGDDGEGWISSVESLRLGSSEEAREWSRSAFPDINQETVDFGVVYAGRKLYVMAGGQDSFEVLDLDNLKIGWALRPMPVTRRNFCRSVVVGDRYIYVLANQYMKGMCFDAYDTYTGNWETNLKPNQFPRQKYSMTSLAIPGEGTFIIVLGGTNFSYELESSVEAYHVETKKWSRLPDLPEGFEDRNGCMVTSMGNRYVLVAGGKLEIDHLPAKTANSVIALDWTTKEWLELPSLPEAQSNGAGAFVAGTTNKWIVTGGWDENNERISRSVSLDMSLGIGWAKEKLLLLCFRGKAQKTENEPACLLENLDAGTFANILLYLIVPFPHEIGKNNGSIFATMMEPPSSHNMKSTAHVAKKLRISLGRSLSRRDKEMVLIDRSS
jgi:hypothetical protein